MCRALKILCAAPTPERLAELKRATVTVHWELVGGATSVDELAAQIEEWNPDVVVLDKGFESNGEARARQAKDTIRVVVVETADADSVREAILRAPQPGGPVRF
jgi:AmiR/NasT family two-component response regulator